MPEKGKREMLEYQINQIVRQQLKSAEESGKLDYINLSIKNFRGDIQVESIYREKVKVY